MNSLEESRLRYICRASLLLSVTLLSGLTVAQTYPIKPVKIVVPFAPGGPTDVLARLAALKLQEQLGQPFIVDFKAGGGGVVGTDFVAKSAPDGYTLLMMSCGSHTTNPSTHLTLPYDSLRDFAFISPISDSDNALVVNPKSPATNVKELIEYARSRPGKLNYGSGAIGGPAHLAGALFNKLGGMDVVYVPYQGTSPALTALLAGHLDMMFAAAPSAIPLARAGKVRILGVASLSRSPFLPDTPTIQEQGLKNFEVIPRYGFAGPGAMPQPMVSRLSNALKEILASQDYRESLMRQGARPEWLTPEQFTAWIRAEISKWAIVIKEAGIKLE